MPAPFILLRSALPGAEWPAIVRPDHATALALQYQLERSQWLPAEELRELQSRQLDSLMKHAFGTVPFYRRHWDGAYDAGAPLTPERFARLPLLTRRHLQESFDELRSNGLPPAHGQVGESQTSGSTGTYVRVLKTELAETWFRALIFREHLWHRRDFTAKLAAIRMSVPYGEAEGWGPATEFISAPGRSVGFSVRSDVSAQLEWLAREQPDYLLTYPSNAAELAKESIARGISLPKLREVRTIGELLPKETRELAREAWGASVVDVYSSEECGQIALQCPEHEHYHVQSESVLLEVLDDEGGPCAPGAIGRVVLTTLQNFAMPLIRYDIGDFAEAGPACPCGRTLPVLQRIVGRVRNMLVTADGRRYWPRLGSREYSQIAPVRQHQLVQKAFDEIEVRLVTASPLNADQEQRLRQHIQSGLPVPMRIDFVYCEEIARSAGGKFEDFMSEVAVR